MNPFNEPDSIEKTFLLVGMIASAVLLLAIFYGFFFLH